MNLILLNTVAGAASETCTFGALNQGDWIAISTIIVLLAISVGGLIYALSSFLSTTRREKLRGIVKAEIVQGIIALFIILILVIFAGLGCQMGNSMTQGLTAGTYQDPFQFAQLYMNNLLFTTSGQIFGDMYVTSINYLIAGNLAEAIIGITEKIVQHGSGLILNANILGIFYGYASVSTSTYTVMMMVSYGVLFIMWLLLVLAQSFAITMMVPLALVIRMIPFGGPKLREAADAFLAIAIAFYFILPLTLVFNNYAINWMFCTNNVGLNFSNNVMDLGHITQQYTGSCNPYYAYAQNDMLINLPFSSILDSNTPLKLGVFGSTVSIDGLFFGGAISGNGGLGQEFINLMGAIAEIPAQVNGYGIEISEYMFSSLVLIALDIAITIGFAQGLARGLGSISGAIGVGPFWGNM